jgi:uncharacterized protein YxjI
MNEFADYRFCSTWDGDGEIYNQENKIIWRFKMTGLKQHPAEVGIVPPPSFALNDADGKELVTISREKRLPLARYVVTENGSRCCTIWQRSIWFTKYEFEFDNKLHWKFYMPMFSVSGKVISETGAVIRVQARTRREWYVRFDAEIESTPMIAALTFVVRNKLQRS